MVATSALALSAAACSPSDPKPEPVVVTKIVTVDIPPEARKPCPELSPRPDRDLTQAEILENWSHDRTARNVCEVRRAAAIDAIDVAKAKR